MVSVISKIVKIAFLVLLANSVFAAMTRQYTGASKSPILTLANVARTTFKLKPRNDGTGADGVAVNPVSRSSSNDESQLNKMHLTYTTRYAAQCNCTRVGGMDNGVCYTFTTGSKCVRRQCKAAYVCILGLPRKKHLPAWGRRLISG